jgi:hypothetical protein
MRHVAAQKLRQPVIRKATIVLGEDAMTDKQSHQAAQRLRMRYAKAGQFDAILAASAQVAGEIQLGRHVDRTRDQIGQHEVP